MMPAPRLSVGPKPDRVHRRRVCPLESGGASGPVSPCHGYQLWFWTGARPLARSSSRMQPDGIACPRTELTAGLIHPRNGR
jgi:hypothetical protein